MTMRRKQQQGYSLLELSVVMLIIALVAGAGLLTLMRSLEKKQQDLTDFRLRVLQESLYKYRLAYNRLPCPANLTLSLTSNVMGVEAANPGRCVGGSPAANFSTSATVPGVFFTNGSPVVQVTSVSTFSLSAGMYLSNGTYITGGGTTIRSIDSDTQITLAMPATLTGTNQVAYVNIAAGAVPVRTLGLSDDFAVDGWGRRFTYAVSVPFTASSTFTKAFDAIPVSDVKQRIRIVSTGTTNKVTNAAYAIISYGKNGHGAYTRNGGTTRFNANSSNTDEQINCDCNNAAVAANSVVFTRIVQKLPTENSSSFYDSFDDIVVFATRQDLRSSRE